MLDIYFRDVTLCCATSDLHAHCLCLFFFYIEYRIFSTDRGQWFCIWLLREGEVQRSYQKSIIQSRVGPGNQQFILSAEKIVHSRARCITILGGKYTYGDTRGALDKRDNENLSSAVELNKSVKIKNYMFNFTAVFGKICGFCLYKPYRCFHSCNQ